MRALLISCMLLLPIGASAQTPQQGSEAGQAIINGTGISGQQYDDGSLAPGPMRLLQTPAHSNWGNAPSNRDDDLNAAKTAADVQRRADVERWKAEDNRVINDLHAESQARIQAYQEHTRRVAVQAVAESMDEAAATMRTVGRARMQTYQHNVEWAHSRPEHTTRLAPSRSEESEATPQRRGGVRTYTAPLSHAEHSGGVQPRNANGGHSLGHESHSVTLRDETKDGKRAGITDRIPGDTSKGTAHHEVHAKEHGGAQLERREHHINFGR